MSDGTAMESQDGIARGATYSPNSFRPLGLGRVIGAALALIFAIGGGSAFGINSIVAAGPLTEIAIGDGLQCGVRYAGDSHPEFFGPRVPGACGTFVAVGAAVADGGTVYGPADLPAGSTSPTPFTAVSQSPVSGNGLAGDPYRLTTAVALGDTGLELTQTVTYVNGQEAFRTDLTLRNRGATTLATRIYGGADCYLGESDFGYGFVDRSTDNGLRGVFCTKQPNNDPEGRVEGLIPLTPGAGFVEGRFSEVWREISSGGDLSGTCQCSANIDNGMAIGWSFVLTPGESVTRSFATAFSPEGGTIPGPARDSDGDGLPDDWEATGDLNGDGIEDLPLPQMGADPLHKDLFIQVDAQPGRRIPDAALQMVVRAFGEAPVSNPDLTPGITLHVDNGRFSVMNPRTGALWGPLSSAKNTLPVPSTGVEVPISEDPGTPWPYADSARQRNLDPVRQSVFRSALSISRFRSSDPINSGRAAGAPDDTFAVAIDAKCYIPGSEILVTCRQSLRALGGVFMHELGHTLNLRHGGDDHIKYKPNYLSVMNYTFVYGGVGNGRLDYSELGDENAVPAGVETLDESRLDENRGLRLRGALNGLARFQNTYFRCADLTWRRISLATERPVDWDCSGASSPTNVSADISGFGLNVLHSYNDWANLSFRGGTVGNVVGVDTPSLEGPPKEPSAGELRGLAETQVASPLAVTDRARRVSAFRARITGIANPGAGHGTAWFEFGRGDRYGSRTALRRVRGPADTSLAATLTGLRAASTYHYRLAVKSQGEIARGDDVAFTTLALPSVVLLRTRTVVRGCEPSTSSRSRLPCHRTVSASLRASQAGRVVIALRSSTGSTLRRTVPVRRGVGRIEVGARDLRPGRYVLSLRLVSRGLSSPIVSRRLTISPNPQAAPPLSLPSLAEPVTDLGRPGVALRVRPSTVLIAGVGACNPRFKDLSWTSWTRKQAVGTGLGAFLPEDLGGLACADVSPSFVPTILVLSQPMVCGGDNVFTRLDWSSAESSSGFSAAKYCPAP